MIPTANGYFSGAGGMEIGMMQAGVEFTQSLDFDKDAIHAMQSNPKYFRHSIVFADITQKTVLDQPDANIHVFTYPCTKYSPIADIHGTRTGDDLFLHSVRHVVLKRPDAFTVENVPGMKKFPVVMELMTKLPDYYITVFCPVSATNWLPQRRDRLIVIATKKPFYIAEPGRVSNRLRMIDIIEKDPQVEMPDYVIARIKGKYRDLPIIVDPSMPDAVAPTCVAHYSKDMGTRMIKDPSCEYGLRPFSIREYARLQGFPDDYVFENKRSSYKLIGNAVAIPMGRWVGEQMMRYFN